MKVAILGIGGMLGHVVNKVLTDCAPPNWDIWGFGRGHLPLYPSRTNDMCKLLSATLGEPDYVVNCIGAIKPIFKDCADIAVPIYTNAIFPHQLALWASLKNIKTIGITTDCVYSGHKGSYVESDAHDALDEYGKSKSLGESQLSMVLRTSIIGPEQNRARSLFEWIKANAGKEVNGFTNHLWNGLTTLELSHCIAQIIFDGLWQEGIYHLFSETITKRDMVQKISDIWNFGLKVNPVEAPESINRTLSTNCGLNDLICPVGFDAMVEELKVLA